MIKKITRKYYNPSKERKYHWFNAQLPNPALEEAPFQIKTKS